MDPEYWQEERNRNTQEHQQRSINPQYREVERRLDLTYQYEERIRNIQIRSTRRSNLSYRHLEQAQNRKQLRLRNASNIANLRHVRNMTVLLRRLPTQRLTEMLNEGQDFVADLRAKYSEYFNIIKIGPTKICICCDGTWFKSQIRFWKEQIH